VETAGCSQVVALWHSFLLKLFSCFSVSPLYRLQSCRINLVQHGLSMDHSSFREDQSTPVWGPPWAAESISALVWSSTISREIPAPVPGAPPLSPSSLTLVLPLFFLSNVFTLLLCLSDVFCAWCLLHFLNYVFPEASSSWLQGSAVPCGGSVGVGWKRLCLARGSPWPLLTDTNLQHPCY